MCLTLIGMLHFRLDPQNVTKAYAFAAVAKAEGIDFFYFTPGKINFEAKTILGKELINGQWVEKVFPFPDVVYNAGTSSSPRSKAKSNRLKEMIPFTSHSVGGKHKLYKKILEGKKFAKHLIPFGAVTKKEIIYNYVAKYKKIILKPRSGNQGNGIFFVKKRGEKYLVIEKAKKRILTSKEFNKFVKSKILLNNYLIQQYVSCRTKSNSSYDFRIHIQKNGQGKWVLTSIYARIGPYGSIISNISNGGSAAELEAILKQEFPKSHKTIAAKLKTFGLKLGAHMDEIYALSFDELGIDVGIDKNNNFWLYEVNWRPGVPVIFYLELDVAINSLQYAVYLAEVSKNRKSIATKVKTID